MHASFHKPPIFSTILFFKIGIFFLLLAPGSMSAQLLSWAPAFPKASDPITITLDATKGDLGLMGYNGNVYVHVGVITSSSKNAADWKYVPFAWGGTAITSLTTAVGVNRWRYTISNIRSFFNVPASEQILKIAVLYRQGGCTNCASHRNADGSDMYIPVYDDQLALRFEQPPLVPLYRPQPEPIKISQGQSLQIKIISNQSADLSIKLSQVTLSQASGMDSLSGMIAMIGPGQYTVTASASAGGKEVKDSFAFTVPGTVTGTKPLPSGLRPGINRGDGDSSLTLVLVAPGKNKISVLGDFPGNDWSDQPAYQMNLDPDGRTWWLKIPGLDPKVEYSYQYAVDGAQKIADPYAEKILDPTYDAVITSQTYPGLKAYPSGKTNGIVSVVRTNNSAYQWKHPFIRPDKSQLVIYEVLLRDYLANHDFKSLTDTLGYLSRLGINAIELMPVNEFEGNQSWGYNPDFFFAVDKYYGTEHDFKSFIDSCHGRGIAVIMDMVLNHATGSCPLAALYWDGVNQRPSADNPWFNVTARHPFNVFNDFNHESPDTKYFSSRVMQYWLKEYQVDGFRFDLSKGFTQKNNPNDVGAWSAYDASRIAIWKQYYDSIQSYVPGAYVILEHFADNAEEFALADAGMLLWGNHNGAYSEAAMGYVNNANLTNSLYQSRGWTKPHLVSYMESHDEERLMYKNLQFGNVAGAYSTKNLTTALDRMKLATSFFLLSPGPKMIWQFGELGYDYSINTCSNGTVNTNCRLDGKPITWQYTQVPARSLVLDWYQRLLQLRKSDAFQNAMKQFDYSLTSAFKYLTFKSNDLNVVVVGNFDVTNASGTVTFPRTGMWVDLKDNQTKVINQTNNSFTLAPGEYHVYLDRPLDQVTANRETLSTSVKVKVYPNPSLGAGTLQLELVKAATIHLVITNIHGQTILQTKNQKWPAGTYQLPIGIDVPGTYFIKVRSSEGMQVLKYVRW